MKRLLITSVALIVLQLMVSQRSEAQHFSVEAGSADTVAGFPPADDILSPGPVPVLVGGTGLEVNGFSYGRTSPFGVPFVDFSIDSGSAGLAGSASLAEATTGAGEQNYDVYRSGLIGTNILKHDGNGIGPAGFATPLGMAEPQIVAPFGTGVDGYDNRAVAGASIYWTWDSASVAIGPSASGADILLSPTGGPPYVGLGAVYATSGLLGLVVGDNIDALEIWDIGATVGIFDMGDFVLFSLDPTSPSLVGYGATTADILLATTGGTGVHIPESALGLGAGDNVTALSVPEPSVAMLTLGALGLGLVASRRRRRI